MNGPAEHVVVTPIADSGELASAARRIDRRLLLLSAAGLAAFLLALYLKTNSLVTLLLVLAGVLVLAVIAEYAGRHVGTFRAARSGLWSKWYRTISVETNGTRQSHREAYLVLTELGVVIRRQKLSRLGIARYEVSFEARWSAFTTVEYTYGRRGWRNLVVSGPGMIVAAPGAVNRGFSDALNTLGARHSQVSSR